MSMEDPNRTVPGPEVRVRFMLDWIEITDSMDLDEIGEFRFLFRIRSNLRGILRDTLLPEEGTVSISQRSSENRLGPLDLELYNGPVERDETLTLEVTGEEVDLLSPNDPVEWYERSFSGDPLEWVGPYSPRDETDGGGRDPENRAQWRLHYTIETITGENEASDSDALETSTDA